MRNRPVNDSAYLIGGALLGAAAMYLLDPEAGDRRRRRIAAAAEGAYEQARESVVDHLHHASSHARDLAQRVTDHIGAAHHHAAGDTKALADEARAIAAELTQQATAHLSEKQAAAAGYGRGASDAGHRIWDTARGLGARLSHLGDSLAGQAHDVQDDSTGRAKDWRHWLSNRAAAARSRAHAWIGPEEHHAGLRSAAVVSTAVGFCAVGAGAMYFMDPFRGRTRRERLWKQTSGMVRGAGTLMRATGRHVTDRLRRAADDHGMGGLRRIDSRQLVDAIRAGIVGIIDNPHEVQFMADADGSVTVTGSILRHQLENLLTKVHDIPGVSHIINRLNIREPAAERSQENRPASTPT